MDSLRTVEDRGLLFHDPTWFLKQDVEVVNELVFGERPELDKQVSSDRLVFLKGHLSWFERKVLGMANLGFHSTYLGLWTEISLVDSFVIASDFILPIVEEDSKVEDRGRVLRRPGHGFKVCL